MFNIFYRKRGQEYQWGDDLEEKSIALNSDWIMQYGGSADYDSGYHERRFESLESALAFADEERLITKVISPPL